MKLLRVTVTVLFLLAFLATGAQRVYSRMFVDSTPPVLECSSDLIEVSVKDDRSVLLEGVTARDDRDGDLTAQIMINGVSQLYTNDKAKVTYVVFDSSNNMATCIREIRYTDYTRPTISLKSAPVFRKDSAPDLLSKVGAYDSVDGDISGNVRVTSQSLYYYEEGVYNANVSVTNSLGDMTTVPIRMVVVAKPSQYAAPRLTNYIVYAEQGSEFVPENYLARGESADAIECEVDTSVCGSYFVGYTRGEYTVYMTVIVQ